jgi:hypothetical protein
MTVREITETTIEQTCEVCQHDRTLNLDDLNVGIAIEGHINPDVVAMPPCESCGAIEYLIPSAEGAPDHPSPGSLGHRHAMLVDVLHERLINRGRVIAGVEADKLKKKKRSKDELDQWFKEGLKLAKPTPPAPVDEKKPKETPDAE